MPQNMTNVTIAVTAMPVEKNTKQSTTSYVDYQNTKK